MKLISDINHENPALSTFHIELENGETVLGQHSVDFPYRKSCGELFIPEGIEKIDRSALYGSCHRKDDEAPKVTPI